MAQATQAQVIQSQAIHTSVHFIPKFNTTINISGVANYDGKRFDVTLKSSDDSSADYPFHMSLRFDQRLLVNNSKVKQQWLLEERHPNMPIAPAHPFNLTIVCERNNYRILINERPFATFNHRMDFMAATRLEIRGDVVVSHVCAE